MEGKIARTLRVARTREYVFTRHLGKAHAAYERRVHEIDACPSGIYSRSIRELSARLIAAKAIRVALEARVGRGLRGDAPTPEYLMWDDVRYGHIPRYHYTGVGPCTDFV